MKNLLKDVYNSLTIFLGGIVLLFYISDLFGVASENGIFIIMILSLVLMRISYKWTSEVK